MRCRSPNCALHFSEQDVTSSLGTSSGPRMSRDPGVCAPPEGRARPGDASARSEFLTVESRLRMSRDPGAFRIARSPIARRGGGYGFESRKLAESKSRPASPDERHTADGAGRARPPTTAIIVSPARRPENVRLSKPGNRGNAMKSAAGARRRRDRRLPPGLAGAGNAQFESRMIRSAAENAREQGTFRISEGREAGGG